MTETPNQLESADILRILEALPHRYPFLLVDKIIEIDGDRVLHRHQERDHERAAIHGAFPGAAAVPGRAPRSRAWRRPPARSACLTKLSQLKRPTQVFFMTIDKAKFRKPVVPGDVIEYHMRKINNRRNMWWFRGEAKVAGVIVAEAEVGAMLVTE